MSRVPSTARDGVRTIASAPAAAGFRPAAAALAVAAAFAVPHVHAQPAGGTAVSGSFTTQVQGNTFIVNTVNGAGNRSVINWQSFSVPANTVTDFRQPTASSTSINRVTGGVRSDIFGTLTSNGNLVLVNPSGIAFGPTSQVNTAGFTASTLDLDVNDAIAGRLLFKGGSSNIHVQGGAQILAHAGDVVLVGSQVQVDRNAVVQASGATVLAAGEKVEILARGLEGIQLEVQAGNEAVNLGTLKGDAVGIFANTLKHSGLVQAQAASSDGGKVVLRASGGDALVDGTVVASAANGKGGNVDVLGQRVGLLAGAAIDASGANGGGAVRIGGDYQGKNADVPNAQATYIDAQASIKADATQQGDGGRVIVWSDGTTTFNGRISARAGVGGGDGGFAEVSGRKKLEFTGRADLRATTGTTGTLLLDPNDVEIVTAAGTDPNVTYIEQSVLEGQLNTSSVIVQAGSGTATTSGGNIRVISDVNWPTATPAPSSSPVPPTTLGLQADNSISIQGSLHGGAGTSLSLHALGGSITQAAGSVIQVPYVVASTDASGASIGLSGANLVDIVAGATNNGNFAFNNAQSLTIGTVATAYQSQRTGIDAGSGDINVTTSAGDVTVAAPPPPSTLAPAPPSTLVGNNVKVQAAGSVTLAGSIQAASLATVKALLGQINQSSASTIQGGSISLQADSDINLQGAIVSRGGITITSDNGGISFSDITASGDESAPGTADAGDVTLQAKGNISGYGIYAQGAYYAGTVGDVSGKGGNVKVTSDNGAIQLSEVQASSGSYGDTYSGVAPGAAGTITLATKSLSGGAGDITVDYDLNASGGHASGTDAPTAGGSVTADAKNGSVTLYGDVYATGGSYMGTSGQAGAAGGSVAISATGDVAVYEVQVDGGSSDSGVGGQGGLIQLTAGGTITGAQIECSCQTGFLLEARGGSGGMASSGNGERGGHGGQVVVTRNGGDLLADGNFAVDASGGQGGSASTDSSAYLGGQGGDGGSVTFASATGKVTLASPAITAAGGDGGYNGDDSTPAASGAYGAFRATGTSVEVTTTMGVDADWINDSVLVVDPNTTAIVAGSFRNNNQVQLSDGAALGSANDFVNAGRLSVAAGASAEVGIGFGNGAMRNTRTGVIDVPVNSSLGTYGFLSNAGTVNVDGTLEVTTVPPAPPPSLQQSAAAATGTLFTNESTGVLSGTGHISVQGGTGTVDNFGTLSPGGAGTVGLLTLGANLVMESGSVHAVDLQNPTTVDQLAVTGSTTTGGTVAVNYLPGASFSAGEQFVILQSAALDASTLPAVNQPQLAAQANGNNVVLTATSGYPPPPPPPPASAPGADAAGAQQVTNNQVVTFADLFVQMSQQQQQEADDRRIGKDDIVITDSACTR